MIDDPSTTSAEYQRMGWVWETISDIMTGVQAVRSKGTRYLPRYEVESQPEYDRRLLATPWRPEFTDILQTLASKPFGRDVLLKGEVDDRIAGQTDPVTKMRRGGLVDDIDGRGSSLTTFAAESFAEAIAKGGHAILVDYPPMPINATRRDEVQAGARPYWIQIPFDHIIALYTDVVGGSEVVTHVRIRESRVEREGFGERVVEQIRVLEPGTSETYEKDDKGKWVSQGVIAMARGGVVSSVPMAFVFLGKRIGIQEVRPPLANVAEMQLELFRALSRQEEILTFAGFPMLSANGMEKPLNQTIEVGPRSILFAPATGTDTRPSWNFIQPDAKNIKEIREGVQAVQADMRRIGLQPLTEQPGNPTATGKAIDAAKAHSAVKAWALLLNDCLEQAMVFTAEYLGIAPTIQTEVSTDFSVLPYAAEPLKALQTARATKDLSHASFVAGLRRFDVLPNDFDDDTNLAELQEEARRAAASGTPVPEETVQIRN